MDIGKGPAPDAGDSDQSSRESKPADWGRIYADIQHEYPGWLRGRAFARTPIYVIETALKAAKERELSRLKNEGQVVANVGYLYLLSKGVDSVGRDQINNWEFIEQVEEAKRAMPKIVATTWLDLKERGALPHWAEFQMDVEMVKKAAL